MKNLLIYLLKKWYKIDVTSLKKTAKKNFLDAQAANNINMANEGKVRNLSNELISLKEENKILIKALSMSKENNESLKNNHAKEIASLKIKLMQSDL